MLSDFASVVTPNKRLARRLTATHDDHQRAQGARAWQAASALPWSAWLITLWRDALEADATPAGMRVLSPLEARFLWRGIIEADPHVRDSLLDVSATAALAADAWQLVHAWGAGGESWRAWHGDRTASFDAAAFATWATAYRGELARLSACDVAQLPDVLASADARVPQWRARQVAWTGFLDPSPQQSRLRAALAGVGMEITDIRTASPAAIVRRATAETPRDELVAALTWARHQVEANGCTRVGIAIESFARFRDDARAVAEDVLCPALQLPSAHAARRPYELSLGTLLADVPLAHAALSILALAQGPLRAGDAAALLRSPYLAGDGDARAACERRWLDDGRHDVQWMDVVRACESSDPPFAVRWRRLEEARRTDPPAARLPRQWVEQWRRTLSHAGWPGERGLGAGDVEARTAWEELLEAFAGIGSVAQNLTGPRALSLVRDLAREQVFQPEGGGAPIAIMGLLEAAGLPFDALWVAGLTAERWPPAPRPNPFLPLRWQRERAVPRSSAARELDYARRVMIALTQSASAVVLSHARAGDEDTSGPSPLLDMAWPAHDVGPLPASSARVVANGGTELETVADECAPALPPGETRGGTGLIAAQSDCPFRATACYRLRVEPWEPASEGLSYRERGTLLHATLAAFWRDVRTHETLQALDADALHERIARAVAEGRAAISGLRWRLIPGAVAEAETERLIGVVDAWLVQHERLRAPFAVAEIETTTTLTLADLTLRLKLDRVDLLHDGSLAVIDYKAGQVDAPLTWFAQRPRGTQLGLYAMALRARTPVAPVRAVAFARLRAGDVRAVGIAAERALWPALAGVANVGAAAQVETWPALEDWWSTRLTALAAEVRAGVATVTPRNGGAPCAQCGLQSLCRIGDATSTEARLAEPLDDE